MECDFPKLKTFQISKTKNIQLVGIYGKTEFIKLIKANNPYWKLLFLKVRSSQEKNYSNKIKNSGGAISKLFNSRTGKLKKKIVKVSENFAFIHL